MYKDYFDVQNNLFKNIYMYDTNQFAILQIVIKNLIVYKVDNVKN